MVDMISFVLSSSSLFYVAILNSGTHQVLAYADDVNLTGDDIRKIEKMQMRY